MFVVDFGMILRPEADARIDLDQKGVRAVHGACCRDRGCGMRGLLLR